MTEYKKYVKKEYHKEFIKICEKNSHDFYSCGCILTAHLVLQNLMEDNTTPKQAWNNAMEQTPYHSGMSASMVAIMVAKYSPRGDEFKKWCKKDDVVMVDWKINEVNEE